MGYRLEGPRLEHAGRADILSDATPIGSLQVPASGQPILLMADRQTTGGYPKIGVVISADLPVAGQLAPGDWVEFLPCTRATAVEALRLRYGGLRSSAP
jgi:antagonist of KipI